MKQQRISTRLKGSGVMDDEQRIRMMQKVRVFERDRQLLRWDVVEINLRGGGEGGGGKRNRRKDG